MASGDTILTFGPQSDGIPTSSYAREGWRNNHPTLKFATGETAYFEAILPRLYAGGGLTVYLIFSMASATANNVKWQVDFERIGTAQDIDSDGFTGSSGGTGDVTVSGTSGVAVVGTVTRTDGAQIDSIAVGEKFRISVARVVPVGTDATGDAELLGIEIKET